MIRRRNRPVVETVAEQTKQAASLAGIEDQALLADPRTNPRVRGHADALRDDQQRRALDLEHRRALRRGRVADNRAGYAERTLEAIQAARETASPALSVVALHVGRRRFMGASLAASLLLSVGSALGVEAAAQGWDAPSGVGYLAEVGMTGLATTVILYRSHLTQHRGAVTGWQNGALWVLMLAPLLGSIIASTTGSGPVGAACSIGAAAFALLAYVVADRSSNAMRKAAARVDQADETELRTAALGEDLFTLDAPAGEGTQLVGTPALRPGSVRDTDGTRPRIDGWLSPEGRPLLPIIAAAGSGVTEDDSWVFDDESEFADQVEAYVRDRRDPPDGSAGTAPVGPSDTPSPDAASAARDTGGDTRGDQHADDGGESTEVVLSPAEAKRLEGVKNRTRIAEYLVRHPHATVSDIAEAVGLTERTVQRHRQALRGEG
ncbi:winged helix-turn-helix DNA-binding protein [Nocardiopsis sp. Huas11]|uniref:winged helix-turn-helix domain-containing protein n=1 Tax=Nocardiopsis sp. Huas11 TaxID=2183912 RepID=UPI000EADE0A6|nr:winged helix-turn-helix domain-containing protein [Nocardiopsis sp. Huas11]RKS10025.1 winged helix-turn-helix DNA-binding protein [Nocardiopsis sp. Huas11]